MSYANLSPAPKPAPSKLRSLLWISLGAAVGFTLTTGCALHKPAIIASTAPAPTIDRQPALAGTPAPFVEALLEYVGPPDKWAGPRTVTLHLLARDTETAAVYLTPSFLPETGHVPQIAARSELEDLARLIQGPAMGSEFSGCLYPIRARLIRADGTIVDREGCRSLVGWPSAVSRSVSTLMATAFPVIPNVPRLASGRGSRLR